MQRILSFGRLYGESAEFSVDEGESISFTLVREDRTTTVGEAEAELWRKSAVGNDHWTTIAVLNDAQPSYELHGTDERMVYKWVRKAGERAFAIDRSVDAALSRTLRAPVNLGQPDFDHATLPLLFKAQSGTDGASTVGIYDVMSPVDPSEFGVVFSPAPDMPVNGPDSVTYISVTYNPTSDTLGVFFYNDNGDGTSDINWAEYIGGYVYLYTECPDPSTPALHVQQLVAAVVPGTPVAGEADAYAVGLDIKMLLDGDDKLNGIDPLRFFAEGNTFFVALRKPGQNAPSFNLGAKTGRFSLDQNDIPARLSAWPFDTSNEDVALSLVEGSAVIPMIEDDERRALNRDNTTTLLEGPGEYEWERSCNSSPGVYVNTGWRA